ncbi:hypothetical protein IGI80_002918 [Enterococcus sp. DIV1420a]
MTQLLAFSLLMIILYISDVVSMLKQKLGFHLFLFVVFYLLLDTGLFSKKILLRKQVFQ